MKPQNPQGPYFLQYQCVSYVHLQDSAVRMEECCRLSEGEIHDFSRWIQEQNKPAQSGNPSDLCWRSGGVNLGRHTDYCDWYFSVISSDTTNARIIPSSGIWHPSISFPIHYSLSSNHSTLPSLNWWQRLSIKYKQTYNPRMFHTARTGYFFRAGYEQYPCRMIF
jgi:hypothetical protein